MSQPLVVGAALGDCVHVAGVLNFLAACRRHGYRTTFLGPAVEVERLVEVAAVQRPDLLAVSYRLTPQSAERLLAQLAGSLERHGLAGIRAVFGGPPPVVEVARRTGLFAAEFGAADSPAVDDWLAGLGETDQRTPDLGANLVSRWQKRRPRPLIRHHFGLPTVERTVKGIAEIADSGLVDVISIGPDQNAQEHFFQPDRMDPAQDGAGGVPVRTPDDFRRIYEATRRGNQPLLRCYSGTTDLIAMAAMLQDTIRNAWCAVPVFWYSELDGRSTRTLEEAIAENQGLVEWSAARSIPVERNDQNQWGLRAAHDTLQVAAAALAARLSARAGVSTYILQMMLNNPAGISPAMDIAKMWAMDILVRRHVGMDVLVLRELRAGLFSFPPDPEHALGQLASATRTAMYLAPDIIHVVGHTEADHATEARELVTACAVVDQVISDAQLGLPDPTADPVVQRRRDLLVAEAGALLDAVEREYPQAFEGDPEQLGAVVRSGMFDAPYLAGSPAACGRVVTVVNGGCDPVDATTGRVLAEADRLAGLTI